MTEFDTKLAALFAMPPTPPDEGFVSRIDRAVMAEKKMLAAHAAMWRRFCVEFIGGAAVIAAFYFLWKIAPSRIVVDPLTHAPGLAAGMVILLWLAVQFRPSDDSIIAAL